MPEFTCALCGGTFPYLWTEEEAQAEYAALFPEEPIEEQEVVCDDCYALVTGSD